MENKNFFDKIKTFFIKTKDFNFLMLYIILLCCMEKLIYIALLVTAYIATSPLEYLFGQLSKLFHEIGLPGMGFALYCFFILCIPMVITKLFLEKNWSKYLNYFFDHIQYPTIVLICYILAKEVFNVNIEELYQVLADYTLYSVYFIAFIRKFIKPLYKHIFKIYFILAILLSPWASIGD